MTGRREACRGTSYHRPSRRFFSFFNAVIAISAKQAEGALASTKKPRHHFRLGRPVLSEDCFALLDARKNNISIQETKSKGLGAFMGAGAVVKAGDWIGEYKGEILSRSEVEARYWNTRKCKTSDRRWKKSRRRRHQGMSGDYLFDMGDDMFLDGEDSDLSSWCRFMNHAPEVVCSNGDGENSYVDNIKCNVESRGSPLRLERNQDDSMIDGDHTDKRMPRLWFLARRDIASGEELLYDYGDDYWPDQ